MRYLIAAAVLGLAGSSFAETINVPADYPNIQAAIDAAVDGDEVVVAPGTYTGSNTTVVDMLGKAITLRASGAPEETIIDGENARRGISCDSGETAATTIVGFSITGGSATSGGGIYCYNSNPTLTGCVIEGNTAVNYGGGIYCQSSSNPTITNCTISNNTTDYGGGIYCNNNSSPTLIGCTISNNTANYLGGGVSSQSSSNIMLTDCTISNNTVTSNNGGGGIYCSSSNPTISGCTIFGNIAISGRGGGICCNGSNTTITDCMISGNQAALTGGGIQCEWDSNLAITGCMIMDNIAIQDGGGIYVTQSFPALTDTQVCGNVSDQIYGVWNDSGENEINEVCPDVVGACCTGNQSGCVASAQADCEYFGGTFMGYGVLCADASCPTTCLGDVNSDGEVSVNDILTIIANWGPCP